MVEFIAVETILFLTQRVIGGRARQRGGELCRPAVVLGFFVRLLYRKIRQCLAVIGGKRVLRFAQSA